MSVRNAMWHRESLCCLSALLVCFAVADSVRADVQTWVDGGADNVWSTNSANWTGGAVWTNGNSAVFAGAGGTIDVSAVVAVSNLTFGAGGYTIADPDANGTLTFMGGPTIVSVPTAGTTGVIYKTIGGAGFTKTGAGVLRLAAANTFTGVVRVAAGVLRLTNNTATVLGSTGTGHETIVEDGATLDANSAWSANVNEDIVIKGAGVDGNGAFVNNGAFTYYNVGYHNLTLAGDATIGGSTRFDMSSSGITYGNGFTLTKMGACEVAVGRPVTNCPIVINAGTYTVQSATALGEPDYATTLNGGKLMAWGSYTLGERIIVNGGTISSSGTSINALKFTGNITLNSNVVVQTEVSSTNSVEFSGLLDGAGGLTRNGSGYVYVTGDANTFSGPTIVNGGSPLWIGKTVGGTGRLGAGAVTNNGTLYANSAVLGTGPVVNNGTLYLNPPSLSAGRIVNAGTAYGTSVVQAASGVVNSGTWQCYPGSFGGSVVTNLGTMNLYTNFLVYGQFVNGGRLNLRQPLALTTPITFNGGSVYVSDTCGSLAVSGTLTTVSLASFDGTNTAVTDLAGPITGPGGIAFTGDGLCVVSGTANDYAGPTIVNSGKSLYVGKPAWAGNGSLGSGAITNQGNLYFDSASAYVNTSGLNGWGTTVIRYGGQLTFNGGQSSNSVFRIGHGSLTLTNGAVFCAFTDMSIAERLNLYYGVFPTNCLVVSNILATATVNDGCTLIARSITFGNGINLSNGGAMTGILNQVGGLVHTTGNTDEGNGVRLGHYPQAISTYNMMGGTLVVENDWDLSCATDGQGWFNMTGGAVFTKRVMLNERNDMGGYGRLTVSGGRLNVGSLTGSTLSSSNGICADLTAPYAVQFGGAGATICAVTNVDIAVSNVLVGAGANAVTFDTQGWLITMTNLVAGSGGFNKRGSGTLLLSGNNTFTGQTQIAEGTLQLIGARAITNVPLTVAAGACVDLGGVPRTLNSLSGNGAISNGALTVQGVIAPSTNGVGELLVSISNTAPGGTLVVDADTNGVCSVLHVAGALSLSGMSLRVTVGSQLDRHKVYTVVRSDGALSGRFSAVSLPDPWYAVYDRSANVVQLSAAVGTVISLR